MGMFALVEWCAADENLGIAIVCEYFAFERLGYLIVLQIRNGKDIDEVDVPSHREDGLPRWNENIVVDGLGGTGLA